MWVPAISRTTADKERNIFPSYSNLPSFITARPPSTKALARERPPPDLVGQKNKQKTETWGNRRLTCLKSPKPAMLPGAGCFWGNTSVLLLLKSPFEARMRFVSASGRGTVRLRTRISGIFSKRCPARIPDEAPAGGTPDRCALSRSEVCPA